MQMRPRASTAPRLRQLWRRSGFESGRGGI
jgi:hypothetical protein